MKFIIRWGNILKNNLYNTIILSLLIVSISLLSIAYSAFSTELTISGEAVVLSGESFGINDINLKNVTNSSYENYNSEFSSMFFSVNITLPSSESTLTYSIEFNNNTSVTYYISDILENLYSNENIIYEIVNYDELVFEAQSITVFEVVFYYDSYNSNNTSLSAELELVLESGQTFANYIISLSSTDSTVVHETYEYDEEIIDMGYRYEGNDANNYILFNDELWRAFGTVSVDVVEDSGTTTEKSLVKIMKYESLGTLIWDSGKSNNWPESDLYIALNNDYLYSEYEGSSIDAYYLNYIENVVWYLGGIGSTNYQTANVYESYVTERSDTVKDPNPVSTTGYVGLLYVSDYGLSVSEETCDRDTAMYSFDVTGCYDNAWVYTGEKIKTIVPRSSSTTTSWIINTNGSVGTSSTNVTAEVHPAVYLTESVYIVSGSGTYDDPYIISI